MVKDEPCEDFSGDRPINIKTLLNHKLGYLPGYNLDGIICGGQTDKGRHGIGNHPVKIKADFPRIDPRQWNVKIILFNLQFCLHMAILP